MPALPTNFSTLLTSQLGAATAGELLAGYDLPRQTAIRLNRAKAAGLHPNLARVAHAERGYLLPERPVFALDPLWHAGVYYVQEANSMLLGKVMAQVLTGTETAVLDLCAAPGGKSTLLTDALPEGCLLVSNEVVKARQPRLAENLARWGTASHAITGLDPAELGKRLPGFFDVVVVDAPCSGEGLFRKEPEAVGEWSPVHVQHCAARQRRILSDIWPVIKPGGYLIYSTCTLNADEDEASLRHLLALPDTQAVPIAHQPIGALPALDGLPGLRMAPDASGGEGFFISLVRKQGIDWVGFAYSSGKKSRLQEPGRK